MNFMYISQWLDGTMELIERLLTWNSFNIELSLIKVILRLKFIIFDSSLRKSEHIEFSHIVKKSFVIINWKVGANQIRFVLILKSLNISIYLENSLRMKISSQKTNISFIKELENIFDRLKYSLGLNFKIVLV